MESDDRSPGSPHPPVLANAAALGPRFAAVRGRPDGWTPAGDLFGERLAEHVDRLGRILGASPAVAGTLLLQQYAAILSAPVLAARYEEGVALPCALPDVSVAVDDGRPVQLAFARPAQSVDQDVDAVAAALVDRHLAVAVAQVHHLTRAGRRVLRGAVANAIATAFLHLSWRHPDRAHHVAAARAFLRVAGLADVVGVDAVQVAGERWLCTARHTCCLAFRTSRHRSEPDPYCADCPVLPQSTIRPRFEQAALSYQRRHPAVRRRRRPGSDSAGGT